MRVTKIENASQQRDEEAINLLTSLAHFTEVILAEMESCLQSF